MFSEKLTYKNSYIDPIDKKQNKSFDVWYCSDKLDSYQRYTQNGYFERINNALRSGHTDDFGVINDIKNIDFLFETLPNEMKNAQELEVYRGTKLYFDVEKALSENNGSFTFTDKGFVSTSKSIDVATNFAASPNKVILHITIPKGSAILDDEKLPSSKRSAMKNEQEVLLPRNSQFKITSYNPKTRIAEAIYLGQKPTSSLPRLIYTETGTDNLADLNKAMLLNPIKFDKYNSKFNKILT